jgi:ABC-type transport system involved in cytochrome c biogenesis permease subunit
MPSTPLHGITHACFGLSYLVALSCELLRLWRPMPWLRPVGIFFAAAGLLAHTIYLAYHQPSPAEPATAVLLVAWVMAVFSLYGTLHHPRQQWGIFVLPVVGGLVGLSLALATGNTDATVPTWLLGDRVWGGIHGILLVLAAVGVTVAFLSGVMYLVQAARVNSKMNPLGSFRLLNLERLEEMNRRAVNATFPLLTAGLILGGVLLRQIHNLPGNWLSVKVLGTAGLWLVFLVLLYLRYAANVSARRLAWLSIIAFVLTVIVLASTHPFAVPLASGGTS